MAAQPAYFITIVIPHFGHFELEFNASTFGCFEALTLNHVITKLQQKGLWVEGGKLFFNSKEIKDKIPLADQRLDNKGILFLQRPRTVLTFDGRMPAVQEKIQAALDARPEAYVVSATLSRDAGFLHTGLLILE